jgi:hypothetical protein
VTLKGESFFGTRSNSDVPKYVQMVRNTLQEVSFPPGPGLQPDEYPYGFGTAAMKNAGTPETLKNALTKMATAGWRLYDAIVPAKVRQPLNTALEKPDAIVQVAHVLLEKTIPWAALYDHKYDDTPTAGVERAICLAAIHSDGSLRPEACGTHADCPLSPARIAQLQAVGSPVPNADSVVCPRYFWGFRHTVWKSRRSRQPIRARIHRQPAVRMPVMARIQLAAGMNSKLIVRGRPPDRAALARFKAGGGGDVGRRPRRRARRS